MNLGGVLALTSLDIDVASPADCCENCTASVKKSLDLQGASCPGINVRRRPLTQIEKIFESPLHTGAVIRVKAGRGEPGLIFMFFGV